MRQFNQYSLVNFIQRLVEIKKKVKNSDQSILNKKEEEWECICQITGDRRLTVSHLTPCPCLCLRVLSEILWDISAPSDCVLFCSQNVVMFCPSDGRQGTRWDLWRNSRLTWETGRDSHLDIGKSLLLVTVHSQPPTDDEISVRFLDPFVGSSVNLLLRLETQFLTNPLSCVSTFSQWCFLPASPGLESGDMFYRQVQLTYSFLETKAETYPNWNVGY